MDRQCMCMCVYARERVLLVAVVVRIGREGDVEVAVLGYGRDPFRLDPKRRPRLFKALTYLLPLLSRISHWLQLPGTGTATFVGWWGRWAKQEPFTRNQSFYCIPTRYRYRTLWSTHHPNQQQSNSPRQQPIAPPCFAKCRHFCSLSKEEMSSKQVMYSIGRDEFYSLCSNQSQSVTPLNTLS